MKATPQAPERVIISEYVLAEVADHEGTTHHKAYRLGRKEKGRANLSETSIY